MPAARGRTPRPPGGKAAATRFRARSGRATRQTPQRRERSGGGELSGTPGEGAQQQLAFHLAVMDRLQGESRVSECVFGVTVGVAAVREPEPWASEPVLPAAQ